jgi:hypothetical protein
MPFKPGALALGLLLVAGPAAAQEPQPGHWSMSPSLSGASVDDGFGIQFTPAGTAIMWEPAGKVAVSWGPVALLPNGSIEFHRAGDSTASCTLQRVDDNHYKGTCRGFGPDAKQVSLTRNLSAGGAWLAVSDADFRILARARQILSGPSVWNHHGERLCEDDRKENSWSLSCALEQASLDVTGTSMGFRPAGMDVRAGTGVLKAFNNAESRTYADIVRKLDEAEKRLQERQECFQTHDWKEFADGKYQWAIPREPVVPRRGDFGLFGENLAGYVWRNEQYNVFVTADLMTPLGKPPDAWLAQSNAITTTAHKGKHEAFDGVDVTGTLRNGNRWRSVSRCGVSLKYFDVPAEAAPVLDRLIEDVFTQSR